MSGTSSALQPPRVAQVALVWVEVAPAMYGDVDLIAAYPRRDFTARVSQVLLCESLRASQLIAPVAPMTTAGQPTVVPMIGICEPP